jgi:peptide/nickel transport system substrate-binding protein
VPVAATTVAEATAVPAVTSAFKQSPTLDELVSSGQLPPVEERLPKNPYTPPHAWVSVGKYGGTLKKAYNNNWGITGFIHEMQYGSSPLRWLKDGLAIGPGFVESWESNADASKWTFKMREGIKWSDGQPFTTKDIMYWWEYTVGGNGKEAEFGDLKPINAPPDEARSGTGSLMTLNAPDDYTFEMVFDAPAPLTADRLAMWTNMFIGPAWVMPRHYMEQFNPILNKDNADWETHQQKFNHNNPDIPRLTGWKLTTFEDGVRAVWDRNPYYWAVDKEGNQLPYIDTITVQALKDKEIEKLSYTSGQVDHAHFHGQGLADIQSLKEAEGTSGLEVRFWDSGSGTASLYFFNFDIKDAKLREAFRDKTFRQALSMAYNRADVQKAVYFGLGELTTGTMSPKAIEYNINDTGRAAFAEWRDSFVKYDVAAAEKMLDDAGYTKGADGFRTLKDGSKLEIQVTIGSDVAQPGNEHLSKNERLVRDWQAIGIDAKITVLPSEGYDEKWRAGEIPMKTAWEVGDGPNHLVYPSWVVADEPDRWAPLHGRGYSLRGTASEKEQLEMSPWERTPPRINDGEADAYAPIAEIHKIYDQSKVEPDPMKRHQLVWDMIKIHVAEGPMFTGTINNPPRIILVRKGLLNVPTLEDLQKEGLGGFVNPWIIPSPATYDPETWYWDDPAAHGG